MTERLAKRVAGFGTSVSTEMSRLAIRHRAVNLGQGFPDFPGPDFVKEAAIQAIRADQNQYAVSHGTPRLRRDEITWRTTEVKECAPNRSRILVVWRGMTNLDPKAERAFLEGEVAELGDFEEKWINGDCAVPGFASLDGLFTRLMEAESSGKTSPWHG